MRKVNLFSREWCDLIFENKNRRYGAYRIRSETGKRYARALIITFLLLAFLIGTPVGLGLFVRHRMALAFDQLKAEVQQLTPLKAKEGFEVKTVAQGRPRPRLASKEKATPTPPEIVEVTKEDIRFGVEAEEDELINEEFYTNYLRADSIAQLSDTTGLPVEGIHLRPVDVVEELPQFPGGPSAFMKWLDAHIVYPKQCINAHLEGELQVSFFVDTNGSIQEVTITKPLHPLLDRIVQNALRSMPRWKPGMSKGQPVLVYVTVPVHFHLK